MTNASRWAPLYVAIVVVAGAAAIIESFVDLYRHPAGFQWLILVGLALGSSLATMKMSAIAMSFSIGETFSFVAVLLFGPAAGALTVTMDSLGISAQLARRHLPLRRLLFNATAPALSMWIAARTLYALLDVRLVAGQAVRFSELALPLALCAGIYFVLNTGLVALAVSLDEYRPLVPTWRKYFAELWVGFFGGAYAAGLVVVFVFTGAVDIRFLATLAPLPIVLLFALRSWQHRLNDRRHADAAIREREEQFRAVFEHTSDALLLTDDERRYLDANPAACALLGIPRDALRSRRIDDFLEPDSASEMHTRWRALLDQGEARGELRLLAGDGTRRVVRYQAKADIAPGQHLAILREVSA